MREQVLAEQGLQCVGDTLARRDQGSGASHSQPPFGLSLSKPRPWRVNEKRTALRQAQGERGRRRPLNSPFDRSEAADLTLPLHHAVKQSLRGGGGDGGRGTTG